MNRTNANYYMINYYDCASDGVSAPQQEVNIQPNTFAPLFASEDNCKDFKRDIESEILISSLYGAFVLSPEQRDELSAINVAYERANMLVNILNEKLLNSTEDEAIEIVQTISDAVSNDCRQHFLVHVINTETNRFSQAKQIASSNIPINTRSVTSNTESFNTLVIDQLFVNEDNYETFKQDIEVDDLISYLYQEGVITEDDNDELSDNNVRIRCKKIKMLITILNTKLTNATEDHIKNIRKALSEAVCNICGQPFLVSTIKK